MFKQASKRKLLIMEYVLCHAHCHCVYNLFCVMSLKGLLGFFLNAVTVAAFLKIRELRTPSNFLVLSLALADMGISANATIAAFSSFLR